MATDNTAHLITRVEEVLCDGAGITRTLDEPYRFRRGVWPDKDQDRQSVDARVQKRVIAYYEGMDPSPDHNEMTANQTYMVTVRVDTVYFLPNPATHSKLMAQLNLAVLDAHRIRRALAFPGNLEKTAAGDECGLASHSLVPQNWSSKLDTKTFRLILCTQRFRGWLTLT